MAGVAACSKVVDVEGTRKNCEVDDDNNERKRFMSGENVVTKGQAHITWLCSEFIKALH